MYRLKDVWSEKIFDTPGELKNYFIERGTNKVAVEIPNTGIVSGLILQFRIYGLDENSKANELLTRLYNGHDSFFHDGWRELGKHTLPEAVERIMRINNSLYEGTASIELKSVRDKKQLAEDYYLINRMVVEGKEIISPR